MFRNPSPLERRILQKLLTVNFVGRDDLLAQLEGVQVKPLDDNGTLLLRVPDDAARAETRYRVPVEGKTHDQDGMSISISLHVIDGKAAELEIYREDSGQLQAPIDPESLDLISMG